MKRLVLILSVILLSICGYSQDSKSLFQEANGLYLDGNHGKALEKYLEIEKSYHISAELYYNIGNTYYKLGNIGRSILYYERALNLSPGDEDLQFNLALANENTADKISPIPDLFYEKFWKSLQYMFSLNGWGYVFTIFYILIIFLFGTRLFIRNSKGNIMLKRLIYMLTAVTIGIILITGSRIYIEKTTQEAVIMSEVVAVFSTPSGDSTELFTIHEGTKTEILEESGEWLEIRLADGKVGWLLRSSVEII
ncbi:tetratricopeptide repeat protein [candidate division KSB1 bacterium]